MGSGGECVNELLSLSLSLGGRRNEVTGGKGGDEVQGGGESVQGVLFTVAPALTARGTLTVLCPLPPHLSIPANLGRRPTYKSTRTSIYYNIRILHRHKKCSLVRGVHLCMVC